MRKIQASIALILFLGAVSCKKTQESSTSAKASITTDQVADIASGSLASSSDGLATNFDDIASGALSLSSVEIPGKPVVNASGLASTKQDCGTTLTDSTTKSGKTATVSYSYFLKYTHALNCNLNNEHDNMVYDLTFHGNYEGPNILSADMGTADFKIAGFKPGVTYFDINGEYKRTGSFTSKVGEKVSGTSSLDIVVTDLKVVKATKRISGGSATVTLSVTVPKGTFTYNGTLVYNGDGTATLTINGSVYSINLSTGVRTKL